MTYELIDATNNPLKITGYTRHFLGRGVYTVNPLSDAEAERRQRAVEKRKAKDKSRKRIGDKARKRNRK